MGFVAAVTQPLWLANLRRYGYAGEVNFWRPGKHSLGRHHVGRPMLFVQKGRSPRFVAGLGIIDRFQWMTIREAWNQWGIRNGVTSLEEMVAILSEAARRTSANSGGIHNTIDGADAQIGCIVLRDVILFPESRMPTVQAVLPDFPVRVVSLKTYDRELPEPFQALLEVAAGREHDESDGWGQLDGPQREAVERHAMEVCREVFQSRSWQVIDVSRPGPALAAVGDPHPGYDLLVQKGEAELHIEVKGTTLARPTITITENELRTAAEDPLARLFVVCNVAVTETENGPHSSGGTYGLYRWADRDALKAVLTQVKAGEGLGLRVKPVEWTLEVDGAILLERVCPS